MNRRTIALMFKMISMPLRVVNKVILTAARM